MNSKYLIGAGLVATFTVALAACAGSMEDSAPKVVGEEGNLVAKKQQWLQAYDDNCDVCFQAFELCKTGDGGLGTCTRALNACVEGGLINRANGDQDEDADGETNNGDEDADAGVVDDGDDNNDGDEDVDAGVEDDGDDNNDGDEDVDAGVEDDGDDNDDVDNDDDDVDNDDDDVDVDVDEAIDEANEPNDGDNDGQPGDQVKQDLIEDIQACLDTAGTCFEDDNADVNACLDDLKGCVEEALDGAFENVCDGQRRRCEERDASDEETESVESLCEAGRDFGRE